METTENWDQGAQKRGELSDRVAAFLRGITDYDHVKLFQRCLAAAKELGEAYLAPRTELRTWYQQFDSESGFARIMAFLGEDDATLDYDPRRHEGARSPDEDSDPIRRACLAARLVYRAALREKAFAIASEYTLPLRYVYVLCEMLDIYGMFLDTDTLPDNRKRLREKEGPPVPSTVRGHCVELYGDLARPSPIELVTESNGDTIVRIPSEAGIPEGFVAALDHFRRGAVRRETLPNNNPPPLHFQYYHARHILGIARKEVAATHFVSLSAVDNGIHEYREKWKKECGGDDLPRLLAIIQAYERPSHRRRHRTFYNPIE